jgi:hypothetical protein
MAAFVLAWLQLGLKIKLEGVAFVVYCSVHLVGEMLTSTWNEQIKMPELKYSTFE